MKNIKNFESFDEDKPIFNFDQTLHVVHKKDVTNTWSCLECENEWENFNRIDPEKCIKCGSPDIKEIETQSEEGDFRDIYSLKKYYENLDPKSHNEAIEEIKSLIESTIGKSGGEFDTFKESFIKDPEKFKIEGLINDSDIYDFYLKHRNSVDEILNDIKFYDEIPSEMNVFGLYDYIIIGTMKSVQELVKLF